MELNFLITLHNNIHSSNFFNQFFKYISMIGENGYIWMSIAIALLFFKKTRKASLYLIIGIGATFVLNSVILKEIFNRPRPFTNSAVLTEFIKSLNIELPLSNSFPSGHTFVAFCSATILTLEFGKKGAPTYILAILIGFSRIFLCVHYPTDVLAGALIGALVGLIIYLVFSFMLRKISRYILKKKINNKIDKNL